MAAIHIIVVLSSKKNLPSMIADTGLHIMKLSQQAHLFAVVLKCKHHGIIYKQFMYLNC